MATANDIIVGAYRKIGVYQLGESLDSFQAQIGLEQLNALVDSWSNEHMSVFNAVENTVAMTPNQFKYSVGNYAAGSFVASPVAGSFTLTGSIPSDIVVNSDITGPGIATGTTVATIGAGFVTLSLAATFSFTNVALNYTICGDWKIQRPLRITNAYTRLSYGNATVDFPCWRASIDMYTALGLKKQPGPYPRYFYYNPTFPLATIFIWPVTSLGGEFHLWADNVFNQFVNLTDTLQFPQGYYLALQFNLALILAPEFGKVPTPGLVKAAADMKKALRNTNSQAQNSATFDIPSSGNAKANAAWILTGGFN